jgi:hypothetical protein
MKVNQAGSRYEDSVHLSVPQAKEDLEVGPKAKSRVRLPLGRESK